MKAFGYVVILGIPDMIPKSDRITRIITADANVPRTMANIVRILAHLKSFCKDALIG